MRCTLVSLLFDSFLFNIAMINANGTQQKVQRCICCAGDLLEILFILLCISFPLVLALSVAQSVANASQLWCIFVSSCRFDCPHPHHKTNEFITPQNDLKWLPHTVRNPLHISSMMWPCAVAAAGVDYDSHRIHTHTAISPSNVIPAKTKQQSKKKTKCEN